MVLQYRLLAACGLVALLFSSCGGDLTPMNGAGEQRPAMLDSVDYSHLSYALGVSAGEFIRRQLAVVDMEAFSRGLQEASEGRASMSESEVQEAMNDYYARRTRAEALRNGEIGKRYLDSVRALPGIEQDSSGLLYRIVDPGTGKQPTDTSYVQVHYYGRFLDGTLLDSSTRSRPALFNLQGVIQGWSIGVSKLREGGKIELHMPPHLGYGSSGSQLVPANSVLVFDVELLKVLTHQEAVQLSQQQRQ